MAPGGEARAAFLGASSASVLPLPTTGPRGDSPRHCDSRCCFPGRGVSVSGALPSPSWDTAGAPLLAVTPDSPPPGSEHWEPPACLGAASPCRTKGPEHVNKRAVTQSERRQAERTRGAQLKGENAAFGPPRELCFRATKPLSSTWRISLQETPGMQWEPGSPPWGWGRGHRPARSNIPALTLRNGPAGNRKG